MPVSLPTLISPPQLHIFFFFSSYGAPRDLPSFPTRRSSDLKNKLVVRVQRRIVVELGDRDAVFAAANTADRKSTRLNSSHGSSSYVVFCLKKKKQLSYVINSVDKIINQSNETKVDVD